MCYLARYYGWMSNENPSKLKTRPIHPELAKAISGYREANTAVTRLREQLDKAMIARDMQLLRSFNPYTGSLVDISRAIGRSPTDVSRSIVEALTRIVRDALEFYPTYTYILKRSDWFKSVEITPLGFDMSEKQLSETMRSTGFELMRVDVYGESGSQDEMDFYHLLARCRVIQTVTSLGHRLQSFPVTRHDEETFVMFPAKLARESYCHEDIVSALEAAGLALVPATSGSMSGYHVSVDVDDVQPRTRYTFRLS